MAMLCSLFEPVDQTPPLIISLALLRHPLGQFRQNQAYPDREVELNSCNVQNPLQT